MKKSWLEINPTIKTFIEMCIVQYVTEHAFFKTHVGKENKLQKPI